MFVINITENPENLGKFLIEKAPLVLKVSAEWCGPCKTIQPLFESLASEYKNISFYHLDINEIDTTQLKVKSLPTFLFYDGKGEVLRIIGADPNNLRNRLKDFSEMIE